MLPQPQQRIEVAALKESAARGIRHRITVTLRMTMEFCVKPVTGAHANAVNQ